MTVGFLLFGGGCRSTYEGVLQDQGGPFWHFNETSLSVILVLQEYLSTYCEPDTGLRIQ